MVTVMVFNAPATGVLWLMVMVLKELMDSITRGFRFVLGTSIETVDAIAGEFAAAVTFICGVTPFESTLEGLITLKVNMKSSPALRDCPVFTVRINEVPVQVCVNLLVPLKAEAVETPVNPEIVTTEAAAPTPVRSTLGLSVTVIVLSVALATGVLWPIFFVTNVGSTI